MQHKQDHISVEELRQLLSYNPENGKFTWLPRSLDRFQTSRHMNIWNKRYAFTEAGSILTGGYHGIKIFRKAYKSHRIAWAIHYGEWPELEIDHINNDRLDNRISNLRQATSQQNGCNKANRKSGTSKYKGVSWNKKTSKWVAQIMVDGRVKHLGLFLNEIDAHDAYKAAASIGHGDYAKF